MSNYHSDAIAIIGLSCRFPGADTLEEFWANLVAGRESVSRLSPADLDAAGEAAETYQSPDYVPAAPLVNHHDTFDAGFFGYTPREAEIRDPQGRLFLESCYSAIEDAGYDVARIPGHVGVFGGMANNLYGERQVARNATTKAAVGEMAIEVSNSPDYLCTAVSYRLGLRGPSVNIQTACSTSLVAIHLACASLRAGESDFALAGGVEVELPYGVGYTWAEGSIYSRDGHVRPFDAAASGTIFGSGVGVALLRRLEDAIADGDPIHAVIRGSAVNNDGGDRAGFTAPGVKGQAMLITEALADADVAPESIGFVEAHATGTLVGDPIEVEGLKRAFAAAGDTRIGSCAVGAVKGNIGHLGPAAGMAGLAKACLALQHGEIPPNVNFDELNPRLDFADSPFYIPVEHEPWQRGAEPRRAGVSSFGIGGTNAHIILEEPPPTPSEPPTTRTSHVVPLSARTATALSAAKTRLADFLAERPDVRLDQLAYTLQLGRGEFDHREALTVSDIDDAVAQLRRPSDGPPATPVRGEPDVVLLFPGQGAQVAGMAGDLFTRLPAFADALTTCAAGFDPLVLDLLLGRADDSDEIHETAVTQPALFCYEWALAEVFESWGIDVAAMAGHSIGELVAATRAGVWSLADAQQVVSLRGRLMQAAERGSMLAVMVPAEEVTEILVPGAELAAINAPGMVTVAGPAAAIDETAAALDAAGIAFVPLPTSHAFHSASMDTARAELTEFLRAIPMHPPTRPIASCVHGTWLTDDQATDPAYWGDQLRAPVQFSAVVATIGRDHADAVLLEAGPGRALATFAAAQQLSAVSVQPDRQRSAHPGVMAALAHAWTRGYPIHWDALWAASPGRLRIPGYPFERKRYWVDADEDWKPQKSQPERALTLDDGVLALGTWTQRPPAPDVGWVRDTTWLVALDDGDHGLAASFAQVLSGAGARVVDVRSGPTLELGTDGVTLDPGQVDHWRAVLEHVASDSLVHILYGVGLAAEPASQNLAELLRECEGRAMYGLLTLGQALARETGDRRHVVTVLTKELYDIAGTEQTNPVTALALGPALLMSREVPNCQAQLLDVSTDDLRRPDRLAARVVGEVAELDGGQLALRGHRVMVREHTPFGLPAAPEPTGFHGTYLITGGLGDLGLLVADHLSQHSEVSLVLSGRSAFPPQADWQALLDDETTSPRLSRQLQQLLTIVGRGTRVEVVPCDIADREQVRALAEHVRTALGPITGIVHSAGVAGGGMLAARSREDVAAVLAPKVAGTVNLYEELGGQLERFVLFSSSTAVTGTFGMVDYCAANNFLDRFAEWARARGCPTTSIGWSGWADAGMAVNLDAAAPAAYRALQRGETAAPVSHPLLDRRLPDRSDVATFETDLRPGSHWVFSEHVVDGVEVVVGAALLEMARAAHAVATGTEPVLSEVVFTQPVTVQGPTTVRVELDLSGAQSTQIDVSVATGAAGSRRWAPAMTARATPVRATASEATDVDLGSLRSTFTGQVPQDYLSTPGEFIVLGEHWQSIPETLVRPDAELVRIDLPAHLWRECGQYRLHPAIFDVAVADGQYNPMVTARGENYLPMSYDSIELFGPLPPQAYSYIRHLDDRTGDTITCDIDLFGVDGSHLAAVRGFVMRRVDRATVLEGAEPGGAPLTAPPADGAMITNELGLDAFQRILAWDAAPHVLVVPEGITEALSWSTALSTDFMEEELAEAQLTDGSHADRTGGTPYAPPSSPLELTVAREWSTALGISQLGIDDNFFDIGGNSLVAVQLSSRIRKATDMAVSMAMFFDFPTIRGLAEAMESAVAALVASGGRA